MVSTECDDNNTPTNPNDDVFFVNVLVTGDKDPELLSDSAKHDVAAVLMKPVQKDRLVKTVERTLMMKERRS